jgi:hypothetical protein
MPGGNPASKNLKKACANKLEPSFTLTMKSGSHHKLIMFCMVSPPNGKYDGHDHEAKIQVLTYRNDQCFNALPKPPMCQCISSIRLLPLLLNRIHFCSTNDTSAQQMSLLLNKFYFCHLLQLLFLAQQVRYLGLLALSAMSGTIAISTVQGRLSTCVWHDLCCSRAPKTLHQQVHDQMNLFCQSRPTCTPG